MLMIPCFKALESVRNVVAFAHMDVLAEEIVSDRDCEETYEETDLRRDLRRDTCRLRQTFRQTYRQTFKQTRRILADFRWI